MDISAEVAAIQAASQGSELRQPLVGALNKLNSGSLPAVTASDAGKILKVGANGWEVGEKSGYMPVPVNSLNITSNDTYDVTNYSEAVVNVPQSSITQADEGKVVVNGALITQTARTSAIEVNGVYDTTTYNSVTVNVSGGGSTRKNGIGPYMSLISETYSASGIASIASSTTINLIANNVLSADSIGHLVLVLVCCAAASPQISVSGFAVLCNYGYITVFSGILTAQTQLTSSEYALFTTVEISDDYEPSVYTNLCAVLQNGSTVNTDYLKTANAFKISAKLPSDYGIMLVATPYDYSGDEYRPSAWQQLNLFIPRPETCLRNITGAYINTGFACYLKNNPNEYNQYYLRGSIKNRTEDSALNAPSGLLAINSINSFYEVPTWSVELSIVYIRIQKKVS